jgi:two-component system sensor histidine kinase PhoQ
MRFPASMLARALISSSIVLVLILLGSVYLFEREAEHRAFAEQAERLKLHIYTLLAQAEFGSAVSMPVDLLDTRYEESGSGLMAWAMNERDGFEWISKSTPRPLSESLLASVKQLDRSPGEFSFVIDADASLHLAHYRVVWDTASGETRQTRFFVAETMQDVLAGLDRTRGQVRLISVTLFGLILLVQAVVIVWSTRPLKQIGKEVQAVEQGARAELSNEWPAELRPLSENLNILLRGEQNRRDRIRKTLGDLAHSLKTPLSVLKGLQVPDPVLAQELSDQVNRMDEMVQWQLQRAVGGARNVLSKTPVAPVVERLRATLLKVYSDRDLSIDVAVGNWSIRLDERDLLELLGNVMDNACKYCRTRVVVSVEDAATQKAIVVSDDGEGISPDLRSLLLERGERADRRQPGQGLGLALTVDIVSSYGGRVEITDSELGGAKVALWLS